MVSRSTLWLLVAFSVYIVLREGVFSRTNPESPHRPDDTASGPRIQLILSDGRMTNDPHTKPEACLQRVSQPWFCPIELISQDFVKERGKDFPFPSHLAAQRGEPLNKYEELHALRRELYWWCDKVPADVSPYPLNPPDLTPADIGIGVFTGLNILYSRGIAARDTWMTEFPNSYFFLEETHETFPVVGLRNAYPKEFKGGVGETAMWALKYMYDHNPTLKWYNVVGCDSWIDADTTVQMLSEYANATGPVWLVYSIYDRDVLHDGMYAKSLKNHIPHYNDTWVYGKDKKPQVHAWTSGGVGMWVNNAVAKKYSEEMLKFRSFYKDAIFGYAPDVDTGAMLTLLGFTPIPVSPKWFNRMDAVAPDVDEGGLAKVRLAKNVVQFHFMKPWANYHWNQFRVHQKVDRIVNYGDAKRLIEYFHEFVDIHFDVMRRRLRDLRTVLETAPEKQQRWGDMVMKKRSLTEPTISEMEGWIQERRRLLQDFAKKKKPMGPRAE